MFFEHFNELCKEHGTTPTSFVINNLSLSSSKVTAWRNGSIPKYEILVRIADYFNVTVGYLFDGKVSSALTLPDAEQKLISDYQALNEQGQEYIQQQMLIAKQIYPKENQSKTDGNNL